MTKKVEETVASLFPRRVFTVSDYELSKGTLKFYRNKGLLRKKMVLVRAIPVNEISAVESYWNELSITWANVTNIFVKNTSFESFSDLEQKINCIIEEQKVYAQNKHAANLLQNELLSIFDYIIPVIDACFDILLRLNEKTVNWVYIRQRCLVFSYKPNTSNKFLSMVNLDFASLSAAITSESPITAANEALSLLRVIHEFFYNLNEEHEGDANIAGYLGFYDSVNLLTSYYALNDIFLGITIDDNETEKEQCFLKESLSCLSDALCCKVEQEELMASFERFNDGDARESIISDAREIFKKIFQQLTVKHYSSDDTSD